MEVLSLSWFEASGQLIEQQSVCWFRVQSNESTLQPDKRLVNI